MSNKVNPFISYYIAQAGEGPWDFPVFEGTVSQRGYGLGGILGGFLRAAIPFALKNIKPVAVNLGKNLLKAAVRGKITKGSLKKFGKIAAQKGIEVGKSVGRAALKAGTKAVK